MSRNITKQTISYVIHTYDRQCIKFHMPTKMIYGCKNILMVIECGPTMSREIISEGPLAISEFWRGAFGIT